LPEYPPYAFSGEIRSRQIRFVAFSCAVVKRHGRKKRDTADIIVPEPAFHRQNDRITPSYPKKRGNPSLCHYVFRAVHPLPRKAVFQHGKKPA
jgi:hypothetical protein